MTQKSRVREVTVTLAGLALLIVLCALSGVGCVNVVKLEYQTQVRQLDG